MIGVVLCGHGRLAPALLEAAELILGEQEHVATATLLPEDSLESLAPQIARACASFATADGVLVLIDLYGGTPFNATAIQLRRPDREVVTGMNLPMVIEVLSSRDGMRLTALAVLAAEAGGQGIRNGRSALGL